MHTPLNKVLPFFYILFSASKLIVFWVRSLLLLRRFSLVCLCFISIEAWHMCSGTLTEEQMTPDLGSTLAVASSMMRMRFFRRMALARHTSCLWPTLKFEPDSMSTVSSLLGRSSTTAFICTCREGEQSPNPSLLLHKGFLWGCL